MKVLLERWCGEALDYMMKEKGSPGPSGLPPFNPPCQSARHESEAILDPLEQTSLKLNLLSDPS